MNAKAMKNLFVAATRWNIFAIFVKKFDAPSINAARRSSQKFPAERSMRISGMHETGAHNPEPGLRGLDGFSGLIFLIMSLRGTFDDRRESKVTKQSLRL